MHSAETPPYFRYLVRLIRPFPDFDFFFIKPLRARAAALLQLKSGDRVLDLGCGPGGSLPYLRDAVGSEGAVVGVEISSEVAINAKRRIARHQWTNVSIVVAPAQIATLTGAFSGVLMFGAPDVYASPEALDNLVPYLTPNARVVFFGAKTSRRRLGWILNPILRAAFPKLSFRSTPVPDHEPWAVISPYLHGLRIEEYFFGWMFLASGDFAGLQPELDSKGRTTSNVA